MKKLFLGLSLVTMLFASSCTNNNESEKFTVGKELSDSISQNYGSVVGYQVYSELENMSDSTFKSAQAKADVIKGIRTVLAQADNQAISVGMQIGLSMLREINNYESQGVEFDRAVVLAQFADAFTSDSLDHETMRGFQIELNRLLNEVEKLNEELKLAKLAEAPEAQQNERAGKAFIDNLKATDPEVKVTESGLAYKITQAGDNSVEITDNTLLVVNYKGTFIDGEVFDASAEGEPATFSPGGVIPGFSEGLKLLGKGAKATLYIPGELAYGVRGVPQAGIGPNQTLIFEVEIVDIKNAE